MKNTLAAFFLVFFVCSCARAPIHHRTDALRKVHISKELQDDLPLEPFISAVEQQIKFLRNKPKSTSYSFGKKSLTKKQYLKGLNHLISLYKNSTNKSAFLTAVKKDFDFYEVYGKDRWSEIFLTSYFEPVIEGSYKKTKKHSQALYRSPKDLIYIDFGAFGIESREKKFPKKGRLLKKKTAAGNSPLIPYYTRKQIDGNGALLKRGLEICWVDPIDAFFLQIQGSGKIVFPGKKELRLGYANQNGHPYVSIGKHLTDVIPKEEITLQSIEKHLRSLNHENLSEVLYKNPSYVFFKKINSKPITYLGTPVLSGRTIATDEHFFNKGGLGLLLFEKPVFDSIETQKVSRWVATMRLVLDQDIGGAIKGPGRVDLFWGTGDLAKKNAGVLKGKGNLYYLVPKDNIILSPQRN